MSILISTQDLHLYKCKDPIPFQCEQCSKTFHRPKNEVLRLLKGSYHSSCSFCSRTCMGLSYNKRKTVNCTFCNETFTKKTCELQEHNFCSRSCNAKYQNSTKTTGFRRSKAENFLESLITQDFSDLIVKSSDRATLSNGLEIDIHLPALKLAIELNGPVHYFPIYGQEKFAKIIENDAKKMSQLIALGYGVIVIDISKCGYWKTTEPYLLSHYTKFVRPIIEERLGEQRN